MDKLISLLASSGETVIGVLVGGLVVIVGSLIAARATRGAARDAADTQMEAARLQSESALAERRLRLAEMAFDRRNASVEQLRSLLKVQEDETRRQWQSSWNEEQIRTHESQALAIVDSMKVLFPRQVTQAAADAVGASAVHARAHLDLPRGKGADTVTRKERELHRIRTESAYVKARAQFMDAVQDVTQSAADLERVS